PPNRSPISNGLFAWASSRNIEFRPKTRLPKRQCSLWTTPIPFGFFRKQTTTGYSVIGWPRATLLPKLCGAAYHLGWFVTNFERVSNVICGLRRFRELLVGAG